MKDFIFAFAVGVFLTSTKGQCPDNVGNNLLTNCEGMTRHGPSVYVDFYLINRPCTCIVTPSFVGEIIVTSREVTVQMCNTEIVVQKSVLYGCPIPNFSSQTLTVQFNQSVEVRADYVSPSTSGTFYNCMGFQQNGGMNGNLSVVCGSQLAAETTTMKISTTTAFSTIQLSNPSSVVLTTISSSTINIKNANITTTTPTILSEERICAESLESLQISLAIFVGISILLTILNIYFFIKIILRDKSRTKKDIPNVIINRRDGNEPNAETYTELGNTVSGESENQYDSLSSQENYINTNVL